MTPSELLRQAHLRLTLKRKIELAKQKFAEDLDKHAARYLRNQKHIDEIKRVAGADNANS